MRQSDNLFSLSTPPADLPDPDLSENARIVLRRRYLRRDEDGAVTETPRQLFWRVARHVAGAELAFPGGTVEVAGRWAERFYRLMASRRFLPNSPTLHNAGTANPMCSACFVLPIEDSIDGIYNTLHAAALVHKSGGGTGFDFSSLRPRGDRIGDTGGSTDGPVAFLKAYSLATAAIRQGTFRSGANMGILRCDHPDILEFVNVKQDLLELENFNLSVAVTDEFLDRLSSNPDLPHELVHPRTGARSILRRSDESVWTVGELWQEWSTLAHRTGEPGLFFVDRVNADDAVPSLGPIRATNPCGEQPLHPWDSCNLGSINIAMFVRDQGDGDGENVDFDWEGFTETTAEATRFLDNVIEAGELPLPELERASLQTRRIGLGVMGFADALFRLHLPYDSEEACAFGEQIMRVLSDQAFQTSRALGEQRGNFDAWAESRYARDGIPMRNAFRTTIAPTGTISILAGCSGGIEPAFSLAYLRQVMADEQDMPTVLREVDAAFERVARRGGYWSESLVERLLEEGSLREIEQVPDLVREVFVTARDVAPRWHLAMQAAFQTHCDSSISKTINFPAEASPEEVAELFNLAVSHDIRGLTCYRDGSRDRQPMALANSQRGGDQAPPDPAPDAGALPAEPGPPRPQELPEFLSSLSLREPAGDGVLTVGISVDPRSGAEREVSASFASPTSSAPASLASTCRLLSLWLRSAGELEVALDELAANQPLPGGAAIASAPIIPALVRALRRYLGAKRAHGLEALLLGRVAPDAWRANEMPQKAIPPASQQPAEAPRAIDLPGSSPSTVDTTRINCPECSGPLTFQEGCVTCTACGFGQC